MTISTTSNTVVVQGNGLTTSFSFTFPVPLASELFVYYTDSTGAQTPLNPNSYSVTGIGSAVGGSVTYPLTGSPIQTGTSLTIQRVVTYQQLTDLVNQSGYYPNVVENALDNLTMQTQQLAQMEALALTVPLSATPKNLVLPSAGARSNQLVGFDVNGNATTYPITSSVGAGNLTSSVFTSGVDFTAGTTTTLTLPAAYGSVANVAVHFDGVYQGTDQYSLSGNMITFSSPIPVGTQKVYVVGGTTLSLYVPPNNSVGDAQLSWGNVLNRVCDSISALAALNPAVYKRAFVTGYYGAGDGGGGEFYYNAGISQALANGGTIIAASGGVGCWLMVLTARRVSALQFGAKGDGVTDDTAKINAAVGWMNSVGGGVVDLPPTGFAYLVAGQIVLTNGVTLAGAPVANFEGMTATNGQWAQYGTWINPTNASSSCILMSGHGACVQDINFIHVQPASKSGWTPNVYGYCIEQINDFGMIRNVRIVNASHGIWLHYSSSNGGGTNVLWDNIIISAFVIRMRTTCVNDSVHFRDIDLRGLWYEGDTNIVSYIMNNTVGWYCGYTDNVFVSGMQFFEDYQALYFIDETCLGNTHSFYNGQMVNVDFNLVGTCMVVAAATTHVRGFFSGVYVQTGNAFGITWATTQFQLGSDNIDLVFNGLQITQAGGQVMTLGNGVGGAVTISNLRIESYSSVAAGQVCFSMAANSTLNLAGYYINMISGNGARFSGAGSGNGVTTSQFQTRQFYSTFAQTTFPHTGSFNDASTGNLETPQQGGYHQARLVGNVTVSTSASGTMALQMSGNTGVAVSGISTSSTGSVSFDSGWLDIPNASMQTPLGRLQANVPSSAGVTNGDMQLQLR